MLFYREAIIYSSKINCPRRNPEISVFFFFLNWEWISSQSHLCWENCLSENGSSMDHQWSKRGVNPAPNSILWAFSPKWDENLPICLSQVGLIFCHLHPKESWQTQVSREESDYSGIGSGFCSQWDRGMLALLIFKTFLQILPKLKKIRSK